MRRDMPRVLVADPDPSFAARLMTVLSSHGYDVELVDRIAAAAERLRDVEFDCIVLDEDMVEMKGHDAVPVLKAIAPKLPVIVTAARNTNQTEEMIRKQDVFYYHVKSFGLDELRMAVASAVGRKTEAPDRGE